jgi:hypothetical protein
MHVDKEVGVVPPAPVWSSSSYLSSIPAVCRLVAQDVSVYVCLSRVSRILVSPFDLCLIKFLLTHSLCILIVI